MSLNPYESIGVWADNTEKPIYGEQAIIESEKRTKRAKEESQKRIAKMRQAMKEAYTGRKCPIKEARENNNTNCEKSCIFYDVGCLFANTSKIPLKDTEGLNCIVTGRKCRKDCSLYYHGCTLTETIKALNGRKDI